ncbi:MAG: TM0106 family RecB-like putative nuclease [Candidatus Dormibacteria bacterium]
MHLIDGRITLSATDLVGALACDHLVQLELEAARGGLRRPDRVDLELDLLARLGARHEQSQVERLQAEGRQVVEIADHGESLDGLRRAEEETRRVMRQGADVIYQAAFFDGTWRGRADFLLRVGCPSQLGDWSYEVADAKLARRVRVSALIQMCEYSLHVERLQGFAPESMHVILGDGSRATHRVADYAAYHRAARGRLDATVAGACSSSYPNPVDHCRDCRWLERCEAQRRADDHLSQVARMHRDQTRRLVEAGISTTAALAEAPQTTPPPIGESSWARLRQQARLQVEERVTGVQTYELLPVDQAGLGLAGLPPPSPGDLFFDMEGDPFVEEGGLEYLFGVTDVADGSPRFQALWGHDRAGEKAAFEGLIDLIMARLERDPALHVYHYAAYESTALKKLMGRHATREDEVDQLLRGGVLVDLYQVVRQGVRVSKDSYSLKALEAYYMPKRNEEITDAGSSIVAYERWKDTGDSSELDEIAAYNQRDCESTLGLRDWLEWRRPELAAQLGRPVARPEPRDGSPSDKAVQQSAETAALVSALSAGLPGDPRARNPEQAVRWLLAQLLDWHRREDKSEWWAYFDRQRKTDEQLIADPEAIGGVIHLGEVGADKQSIIHRYRFDPTQEHKLDVGREPHDPRTGKRCGQITAIDNDAGMLELKRGPSLLDQPHPSSLVPATPFDSKRMRDALRRIAARVSTEVGAGDDRSYGAALELLRRRPPRLGGGGGEGPLLGAGEDPVAAICRIVDALDHSYLAVQGPPGCGKTHTAARVIVDQVRRGRRVGVSAFTHRAIGHLLEEVCKVAADHGQIVRILQKCDDSQRCAAPGVQVVTDNTRICEALAAGEVDVVAGTSWLFADEQLDGGLDVVLIDEAGQMSLANACAIATAASNLVLLGDPQQLTQPSRGIHPVGAEASALEHVLGGRDTIPQDQGVFLGITWRMHPDVCAFISDAFYESRLESHPACARQRVGGAGCLSGSGTRFVAVPHAGNRTWAAEEITVVAGLVDQLLTATWTRSDGASLPITLDDILVVAPYNNQVRRLAQRLPEGARVGTVDRFQGQEAAVTIYAMATSSGDDVPRNLEFLFSGNRLNVAVSRARALSIVVGSPRLLAAHCRTPEQLRLVSALCRYAEGSGARPAP